MNLDSDNLVNLESWKNEQKENSFKDYLKVLSFNDLVNESNVLIDQIKRNDSSDDLFQKTKVMMNEFTIRLEKESHSLATSVKELKKQIEDKLH